MKRITLKAIKEALNIKEASVKTDGAFCSYIFSDIITPFPSDKTPISRIINGNDYRSDYTDHTLMEGILNLLKDTDENKFPLLRAKIQALIDKSLSTIDAAHSIFHEYSIAPKDHENAPHYVQLRYALDMLLTINNRQSICYALSLLVLCSVFWKDMEKVSHLYEPEAIRKVITSSSDEIWPITDCQSFFTDPAYMNTYHAYLYSGVKDGNGELLKDAVLTLNIDENKLPFAVLTLIPSSPDTTFRGRPLFSKKEEMVYVFMKNNNDKVGILCFEYSFFNTSPKMYLRTGIFLTTPPQGHIPHVQKMLIASKALSDAELKLADGFLHIHKKRLYLTDADLDFFKKTFHLANWWSEYEKEILPFIKSRQKSYYVVTDSQLLDGNNPDFSLDAPNQLRILLALRSIEHGGKQGEDQFIDAKEYPHMKDLMK